MKKEKKIWFTGLSRTLWIPKSIEGWSVTVVVIFALYLIFKINKISNDIPFVFSQHWPMLLELAVVMVTLYSVSKGHVDKKY
jgi:hypothetical protein